MENNITEHGLDLIAGHLQQRIKGLKFERELTPLECCLPQNYSIYDVQTLTERMAAYLVMVGYTPVIELVDLSENVAGQINLNDSNIVYIHLDKERFENHYYGNDEIVAILAHELSHKFLRIHGFYDTSMKIEYMTDACAIYVGFGEFLYKASNMETLQYSGGERVRQIRKLGYLTTWQIAYLRNKFFGLDLPYKMLVNMGKPIQVEQSKPLDNWTVVLLVILGLIIFGLLLSLL